MPSEVTRRMAATHLNAQGLSVITKNYLQTKTDFFRRGGGGGGGENAFSLRSFLKTIDAKICTVPKASTYMKKNEC